MKTRAAPWSLLLLAAALLLFTPFASAENGKKALTFEELMKFRKIRGPVISRCGGWIAYQLQPDRGDGEVVVRALDQQSVFRLERGASPVISGDSAWVAAVILPDQKERDAVAGKKGGDKPENGLALLNTTTGAEERIEGVESFAFSDDGRWLAYRRYKEKDKKKEGDEPPVKKEGEKEGEKKGEGEKDKSKGKTKKKENLGTTLVLRKLDTGEEIEIPLVTAYAFDEPSRWLAYAVAVPGGAENHLTARALAREGVPPVLLKTDVRGRYTCLTWAEKKSRLAYVCARDDEDFEPGPAEVFIWEGDRDESGCLAASKEAPEGWTIPSKNRLAWTRDGMRLYFGYKPVDPEEEKEKEKEKKEKNESEEEPYDPYDFDAILEKRGVDVWHWNDPLIIPNQKKRWEREKDRTYKAVVHMETGKVVPLADRGLPEVTHNNNPSVALGSSDLPYRKEVTWDGAHRDIYTVDLKTGFRKMVVPRLRGTARLSPGGAFAAYYRDKHWWLYDVEKGTTRNLTEGLHVPFDNEDHDYPSPPPGYGLAGWVEGDAAVLIYDKFDIWRFPTVKGRPLCITGGEGRLTHRQFRLLDLDKERDHVLEDERLLLSSFHDRLKISGFYEAHAGRKRVRLLLEQDCCFRFLAKAEEGERLLYTRERYHEFPDLWTADLKLRGAWQRSRANPQIEEFAWGESELVSWTSADGIPLQGVLIKPGNYRPGERYPVLVYFYRLSSHRLHRFNETVVNHRPCFPVYASHGYALFLPDIRFEIGRPGFSATKALVPGVQKLVDMGVADFRPRAVGCS